MGQFDDFTPESFGTKSATLPTAGPSDFEDFNPESFKAPVEVKQAPSEGMTSKFLKGAASLADTAYGVVPGAAGGVTYAIERALQKTPEEAAKASQAVSGAIENPIGKAFGITNDPAYQNEASRKVMNFVGENVSKGSQWIAQHTGLPESDIENMINTLSYAAPVAAAEYGPAAIKATKSAVSDMTNRFNALKTTAEGKAQFGSVGSAGTATSAIASNVPPEIASEISKAETKGGVNHTAALRHSEAASLPVPVDLTAGQATGDIHAISHEQNNRGRFPEIAQRFNEQNKNLVQNFDAIRDKVAPDVYDTSMRGLGEEQINSYKTKDAALRLDIRGKYAALEAANGGSFPVNGNSFVGAADSALSAKMKGNYVPPEIRADMEAIRNGGNMTFEQFENMRTNLATAERSAERSGNGNASHAISIVREALENLPMEGETAQVKAIADTARSAAKERFDLLRADPAYKAAINDTVAPEDFMRKYVINGKVNDVATMKSNLAHDPLAEQRIAAGTMNHLKTQSGVSLENTGNVSQAALNKAIDNLDPKLKLLLGTDEETIRSLGRVARYTQQQERGSYVNNSNTLVGALAGRTKNLAEGALNVAVPGLQAGSLIRQGLERRATRVEMERHLKPGAGISLKDFPR